MLEGSVPVKGVSPGRAEESPEGGSCVSTAELVVEESTSETGGGTPSVVAGLVVSAAGFPAGGRVVSVEAVFSAYVRGALLLTARVVSTGAGRLLAAFLGQFLASWPAPVQTKQDRGWFQ